jgi:hypothetical protein
VALIVAVDLLLGTNYGFIGPGSGRWGRRELEAL